MQGHETSWQSMLGQPSIGRDVAYRDARLTGSQCLVSIGTDLVCRDSIGRDLACRQLMLGQPSIAGDLAQGREIN